MSGNNGVIRIGRKGIKKFAFGEDGEPFDVEVVVVFQEWINIDDRFRPEETAEGGDRRIDAADIPTYHRAAVEFVEKLSGNPAWDENGKPTPDWNQKITTAEALDFLARLREQYDELAVFFQPKSREERASPDTSEVASVLRFSAEEN